MNVPELLSRPGEIRRDIAFRLNRAETLRRTASRMTAVFSDVRVLSTPDPSRFQELLAEAADEEAEALRLGDDLLKAVGDAALAVSALPDGRMAELLRLRYLEGLSWRDTVDRLGWARSLVFRLHRDALALLGADPEEA